MATAAPTNPDRPAMLNDVGKALILRYEARGAAGDFDRAIKLLEAAVATAVGSPLRPRLLDNLGSALTARGAASDLDRAIELREAALAATAVGSPLRSRLLDNLGGALTARGAASDLDRAIELREAALAATAPDSPDRPVRLGYLSGTRWSCVTTGVTRSVGRRAIWTVQSSFWRRRWRRAARKVLACSAISGMR